MKLGNGNNIRRRQYLWKRRNQSRELHKRRRRSHMLPSNSNLLMSYETKQTKKSETSSLITKTQQITTTTQVHATFVGSKFETQNIFRQDMCVDLVTPNNELFGRWKTIHPRIKFFRTRSALIRTCRHSLQFSHDHTTKQQVPKSLFVNNSSFHTVKNTNVKIKKLHITSQNLHQLN